MILNWLSHAGLALLLMSLVAGPLYLAEVTNATWIGAMLGIGFYYGREKRDHENRTGEPWHKGWLPMEWTRDGVMDLLFPIVACVGAALLMS